MCFGVATNSHGDPEICQLPNFIKGRVGPGVTIIGYRPHQFNTERGLNEGSPSEMFQTPKRRQAHPGRQSVQVKVTIDGVRPNIGEDMGLGCGERSWEQLLG